MQACVQQQLSRSICGPILPIRNYSCILSPWYIIPKDVLFWLVSPLTAWNPCSSTRVFLSTSTGPFKRQWKASTTSRWLGSWGNNVPGSPENRSSVASVERATLGQVPSSPVRASWASERGWVQGNLTFQHLLKFLQQGLWGNFHTRGTRGTRRARRSWGSWETREASLEEVKESKSE